MPANVLASDGLRSVSNPFDNPPSASTVEVSVFGPGYGESIAVHLGAGDWMVVDSCVDERSGVNAALAYLAAIDVDTALQVKYVVASHAHDDHIRGLADVLVACPNAQFVWPAAATLEEFATLVQLDEMLEWAGLRPVSYGEYRRLVSELEGRADVSLRTPKHAIMDRPIFGRPATADVPEAKVTALSPSDRAVDMSRRALAVLADPDRTRRLARRDPNTFAAALFVEVGDVAVVLGSDLLAGPQGCGWAAVLESQFIPHGKASLLKVPHHGAPNAHHDGLWGDLLHPHREAVVTPYRRGRTRRPAPADRTRICGLTDGRALITAAADPPTRPKAIRRESSRLGLRARNVREVDGLCGQVRARCDVGEPGTWQVELRSPARMLCD